MNEFLLGIKLVHPSQREFVNKMPCLGAYAVCTTQGLNPESSDHESRSETSDHELRVKPLHHGAPAGQVISSQRILLDIFYLWSTSCIILTASRPRLSGTSSDGSTSGLHCSIAWAIRSNFQCFFRRACSTVNGPSPVLLTWSAMADDLSSWPTSWTSFLRYWAVSA